MYNPNSIFVAQKWFEVQVDHRTTFDKVRKEIKKKTRIIVYWIPIVTG